MWMNGIPVSTDFDTAWLAPSGKLDDRYEIQRVLGHGGAAVVLLARDRRYERDVAVKVLKPELSGVIPAERFLQEVRITASLQHPHIVPLLDSGESRGLPYYVTPYIVGGSLRDRMEQARQLPVEEALGIAADVAAALAFAHERNVLHRDIKPENILLAGGHAVVADFGLAQALVRVSGERLTSSGIIVGTPAYMSPEQASGERVLGPTTDIYSLACVIYEMIAGVPPFVGPTVESVIAQRFRGPPHPLKQYRPNIAENVEIAVARAMAIAPADRFQSARDFAAALGVSRETPNSLPAMLRGRRNRLLKSAGLAALLIVGVLGGRWGIEQLSARALNAKTFDASRYVVVPVSGDGARARSGEDAVRHVAAALRRWRDIRILDSPDSVGPTPSNIARRYDAGNYLTTSLTSVGDSAQVTAALWATGFDAAPRAERAMRLPNGGVAGEAPWRRLIASLFVADSAASDSAMLDDASGTASLGAWRAYARGRAALVGWNLARAESTFRTAVAIDPRYAQAQLWLAQAGAWARPDGPLTWRDAAARALDQSGALSTRDSIHAAALAALGTNDFAGSCRAFRALRDLSPNDPVPWLGIGQCVAVDGLVVRDEKSPSGWSFRTSWRFAAAAYDSALRRADGAPKVAFQWLTRILLVDPTWTRDGYSSDSTIFRAYPVLQHDTLAFVPFTTAEFEAGAPRADRSTIAAALRQNATHVDLAYNEWTRRAPQSAEAWEALSFIQEVTGETAAEEGGGLLALRSNITARRLATDPRQRLRLVSSAVRLLAKTEQFTVANALADSVLRAIPRADGDQAMWLAGVAALTGRVERTTELLRAKARARPRDVFGGTAPASPVADAALAFQTLAAAGVCSDALRQARADVDEAARRYVPTESFDHVRQSITARAVSLSVPCLGVHAVDSVDSPDLLVGMQKAVAAGKVGEFRAQLSARDRARRFFRPGDIATDHVYQEAWLLAAIGDSAAAAKRLDLSLTALTTLNTHLLEDIPRAAALGRAMMLRADLAAARGDTRTARRWAGDVLALWKGASPSLAADIARMTRYASTQHSR
jgi:hypothetical protein